MGLPVLVRNGLQPRREVKGSTRKVKAKLSGAMGGNWTVLGTLGGKTCFNFVGFGGMVSTVAYRVSSDSSAWATSHQIVTLD